MFSTFTYGHDFDDDSLKDFVHRILYLHFPPAPAVDRGGAQVRGLEIAFPRGASIGGSDEAEPWNGIADYPGAHAR